MVIEVRIPEIGESILEVTISSMLVTSGSSVKENQAIMEIETDKVNQQIYSPGDGMIFWHVSEGDVVSVNFLVGEIREVSDEISINQDSEEEILDIQKEKEEKIIPIQDIPLNIAPPENKSFVPLKFSKEKNEARKPLSSFRKATAKNLVASLRESAMLTTFNEVNMKTIIDLRNENQEVFTKQFGVKLGLMSFFIKAVLEGIKIVPELNAYIDGEEIVYRNYYNIGIAVSTDKGVIVPVIRNADRLSFGELELILFDYAAKSREGKLDLNNIQEGGFTITNGGVYGALFSMPILSPFQSGVLGIHKISKRPIVENEKIIIADMMYIALSYDHRIIDGKEAVSFLVKVKESLENALILWEKG